MRCPFYNSALLEINCSGEINYIGETIRNVKTRWNKHNTPSDKSNP